MRIREYYTYDIDEPVVFMLNFYTSKDWEKSYPIRKRILHGEDVSQYKTLYFGIQLFGKQFDCWIELWKTGKIFFGKRNEEYVKEQEDVTRRVNKFVNDCKEEGKL